MISFKEMHKLGTFIRRSFVNNIYAACILSEIHLNTLLNKLFLFFLFNIIISTVPNKSRVALTVLIVWFCICAKYKQDIVVFNIFIVKYCTWLFPVRILEQLCLVMLLLNQHVSILIHLFHNSLSLMLCFCLFQLKSSKKSH